MSDLTEMIVALRCYNRWRRGDEQIPQPDPWVIGELIDEVCVALDGAAEQGEAREEAERERDEAREELARIESLLIDPHAVFLNFLHGKIARLDWAKLEHIHGPHPARVERDEARDDLEFRRELYALQTERLQRIERERDEAREAVAKWESSFDAMERAGAEQARRADENREWALRAEQERDEARAERDHYKRLWGESRMETRG